MSLAKVTVICGLMALLLSACGIQQEPVAGATRQQIKNSSGNESYVDDPRIPQVKCLRSDKLPFHQYYADGSQHLPAIQVGSVPPARPSSSIPQPEPPRASRSRARRPAPR